MLGAYGADQLTSLRPFVLHGWSTVGNFVPIMSAKIAALDLTMQKVPEPAYADLDFLNAEAVRQPSLVETKRRCALNQPKRGDPLPEPVASVELPINANAVNHMQRRLRSAKTRAVDRMPRVIMEPPSGARRDPKGIPRTATHPGAAQTFTTSPKHSSQSLSAQKAIACS